jgi:hypothetical protein
MLGTGALLMAVMTESFLSLRARLLRARLLVDFVAACLYRDVNGCAADLASRLSFFLFFTDASGKQAACSC